MNLPIRIPQGYRLVRPYEPFALGWLGLELGFSGKWAWRDIYWEHEAYEYRYLICTDALLAVGSRVIASCPFHNIHNQLGIVDGYVDKSIYPTGHGDYSIKFDTVQNCCFMCDAEQVMQASKTDLPSPEETR